MRSVVFGILLSSVSAFAQVSAPPSQAPAPVPSGPPSSVPPSGTVAAPPRGNGLTAVDIAELPEPCRDLGRLADSPRPNQALSARIALAGCLVDQRTKPLVLCDCEQSVQDLDAAATQSLALLDEVAAIGDPAMKILALQARGDLVAAFATRILATVPPPTDGSEAAMNLHDTRLGLITPLVTPWQEAARTAYAEVDRIARANPQLAKNPAVVAAVRATRAHMAQLTATR